MKLEVIATSVRDAVDAERLGADRIELATGIAEGGMTPSAGMIERVVASVDIPVNVMVRPHSRSFCYDESDADVMQRDIELIRGIGGAGIVIGALTPNGLIDVALLERMLDAATGLDVTFHRAFDETADPFSALNLLAKYPSISRILTSGGTAPAPQAMPRIRELNAAAARTHLRILGGHGLTPATLDSFLRETGVKEVHFGSAVRQDGTFSSPIDPGKMARVRSILHSL
ncbi:MAG: copper homeostasis protein CutC [Cohnella sp.]|nr:copper homeostasis protein CutC [Cohnella sp.]